MSQFDKLIVISVPFIRNARFLLSSKVFNEIKDNFQVLIVTSFPITKKFKEEFGGVGVIFYSNIVPRANKILNFLYLLSELFRNNGYRFRFRTEKLKYHWFEETNITYGKSGIKKKSIKGKLIAHLSGLIGYPRCIWHFFNIIFGRFYYKAAWTSKTW